MRIVVVLLLILFQIVFSDPNYKAPSTSGNDFMSNKCISPPSGFSKSPVFIKDSLCQPYGEFSLTMSASTAATGTSISGTPSFLTVDASGTGNRGAPWMAYEGAILTFNGSTYKSSELHLRTKAEHVMFSGSRHAEGEIQIIMEAQGTTTGTATLSFLVKELDAADLLNTIYTNSWNYQVLKDLTNTNWKINFDMIETAIKNKVDQEVYLNIFTYNGTRTYGDCDTTTWFIYGSELYLSHAVFDEIRTLAKTVTTASTDSLNPNARPYSGEGGGAGEMEITRLCYTGYFKVHLSDNYGLWFGVCSILLFFVFTLTVGEKPIKDYDFHESIWTIHPFVSMWKVNNEIHTLKTRASLFLAMVTVHGLFSSVFYRDASDPKKGSNTIVFAVYSMLINWVITLFVGNILRSYYEAKHQFYKTKEEAWDQKAQNRLFGFYMSVFIIVVVGWSFCVWNMGELHAEIDTEASDLWVASFFIGLGLELIIVYPIVCLLSKKSNFIRRIAISVGFMYDANICHDSYLDFMKHD